MLELGESGAPRGNRRHWALPTPVPLSPKIGPHPPVLAAAREISRLPKGHERPLPGGAEATRKPRLLLRLFGWSLLRSAVRQYAAEKYQLPPRFTRLEPRDHSPQSVLVPEMPAIEARRPRESQQGGEPLLQLPFRQLTALVVLRR